jgi:hypothetical protein
MSQPVWTLSVDLQAKTAVFQSGLADAAKAARGSFKDIAAGAKEAGGETGYSMMEARHSVMMLGEEFGIRMPRALSSFVAGLGPIGPALEAAFPFLAIIGLAALFIEHLMKMKEAGEKFTEGQASMALAIQKSFNSLNDKILEAEVRADELRKDHLGALQHQLELIDHQSLDELARQFDDLAKHALEAYKEIASHWYTFGVGSDGAKHALQEFQTEYDKLLALGKDKEAGDLLRGTRDSAQKTLDMMHQLQDNRVSGNTGDYGKAEQAAAFLRERGLLSKITGDFTKDELKSQESLVDLLNSQVSIEQRIAGLKALQKDNATVQTHNDMDKEAEEAAKKQAEMLERGKAEVARLIGEQYRQEVADTQAGEREVIEATRQGGQDRLNAIDAAIMEERALGLEETNFYRGLWQERIKLVQQMSEEEARQRIEAADIASQHSERMATLSLAQDRTFFQLMREARHVSRDEQIQEETELANREYAIQMDALKRREQALDANGKDYANKLKQIQDQELELTAQHEDQITRLKEKAEEDRAAHLKNGLDQERELFASNFASVIMGHETFAHMMSSIGDQLLSKMLQNAIQEGMLADFSREKDAAKAARKMFLAGASFPFPANIVMAPLLGAAGFTAVMAYSGGTDMVPGDPRAGDVVNAKLTPGEGVIPGGVMDGLRGVARNGGFNKQRQPIHVHMSNSFHVNTIDGDGMQAALDRHSDRLEQHFQKVVRRMNQ